MNVISHNISAMNAQRQFGINTNNKAKTAEKLSSGYRINRASDDAAGLSISEKMRKQIRGLTQGVENTEAGVSLCQVADGALAEVNDMLHRMTELSVQSANGTNSTSDRQAIQNEINELITEIDRISETTKFNDTQIFKGDVQNVKKVVSNIIETGYIPFEDFVLADVDLGNTPFDENSDPNHLNLKAIVNNETSVAHGKNYNLIFGSGSTSSSSVRITGRGNAHPISTKVINLNEFEVNSYNYDETTNTWSRELGYTDKDVPGTILIINQTVSLEESSDGKEKNYVITYDIQGMGAIDVEFMFHADTAYNDIDSCEGYFTDGERVENSCIYSKEESPLINGTDSSYVIEEIPDSFSIVNVDNALAFSEKISFEGGTTPDSVSIGRYNEIDNWNYYNHNLNNNLGDSTEREDLGFSLYYNLENCRTGKSITFRYGIAALEADNNLQKIETKKDITIIERVESAKQYWIQSGADTGDGINLVFDKMDTSSLGINLLNVTTIKDAEQAIRAVDRALQRINENRSKIGAQQNRLEHTIANEENIIENTTASESRIRDADMADLLVKYSKENILEQVGHAIITQANQSTHGILSLLQ